MEGGAGAWEGNGRHLSVYHARNVRSTRTRHRSSLTSHALFGNKDRIYTAPFAHITPTKISRDSVPLE
jgi:hypothetical protein